jgi:small nuclear ribonucleoprotein (snRNP)-like protein
MTQENPTSPLTDLLGAEVVIDLRSTYVCLGTLHAIDGEFLELINADLHDFRDGSATREIYVYDALRLGIRRNRARMLLRMAEVVAIARLDAVAGD